MEAHEIYLGYMAICIGLGVVLGLAAIAVQLVLQAGFYLCLFTCIAFETAMGALAPLVVNAASRFKHAVKSAATHQWRVLTGKISTGVSVWNAPSKNEEPHRPAIIPVIKDWDAACALLGLPKEGFSKNDLTRAYRIAMRAAHPDRGGHPEMAKAFNIARDLIRDTQNSNEGEMT